MNSRNLITLSLSGVGMLGAFSSCQTNNSDQQLTRPNIILILVDDMGYGDLSCYGSQGIETPNIDDLARQGQRFTQFYSGSAVSTPARACLMTGKFPLRYNIQRHFSDRLEYLPTESETIAELLHDAGYNTAHIGKWHLGGLRPEDVKQRMAGKEAMPGPLQQGFDYALTNIEGAPIRPWLMKNRLMYREGGKHMIRNDEFAPEDPQHWELIKTKEAMMLLEKYKGDDNPFFINLWYDTPHDPYEPAPSPHLEKYEALGVTGDQLLFRSMISYLDENVGMLVARLKELDLYDNTLIIFTSDNGPARQGSPGPFKGAKSDLHEGGIRVPFFAVWNGVIPAGSISYNAGHFADILPTLCTLAEVSDIPNDLDGENIFPLFTSKSGGFIPREKTMLWQLKKYPSGQLSAPRPMPHVTTVAMKDNWKLTADSLEPKELFNLTLDHRELTNLLGKYPEIEAELLNEIKEFHAAPRIVWDETLGVYDSLDSGN